MAAGGTGEAAGRAGLALVKLSLTRVRVPAELVAVRDTLKGLALRFEIASEEITRFAATVIEVHAAAMSVTPQTPQGDLRLFLAAESAREVLDAPRLAETIFRRISEQWPLSPYAPKAILAAQQLNPDWTDSARTLLDEQYSGSPYLATVRGYDSPEYRQLEDSLGAFAASLVVTRPGGARRQPVRTVRPERRPPPASGGSRGPEPQ
jgi:hypothetical protein